MIRGVVYSVELDSWVGVENEMGIGMGPKWELGNGKWEVGNGWVRF